MQMVHHALNQTLQPRGTPRLVLDTPCKWYLILCIRHSMQMAPHTLYQTLHANGTSRFVSDTPTTWYLTLCVRYSIEMVPYALKQTLYRMVPLTVHLVSKWYFMPRIGHFIQWYLSLCIKYPSNDTSFLVSGTCSKGRPYLIVCYAHHPHGLTLRIRQFIKCYLTPYSILPNGTSRFVSDIPSKMVPLTLYLIVHLVVPHSLYHTLNVKKKKKNPCIRYSLQYYLSHCIRLAFQVVLQALSQVLSPKGASCSRVGNEVGVADRTCVRHLSLQ